MKNVAEPGLSDEVIRRKKCVKFFDPRHSDASINNPFVYEPNYMGCHENFCDSVEKCKRGDWSSGQKAARRTVPKVS